MLRPLSSNNIQNCSMRWARIQIPVREISLCKTEIVMAICSMEIILRKFPLIGAITNNIHRHHSKNNTFDLDSFTLRGQEGKVILDRKKWIFEAMHEKGTTWYSLASLVPAALLLCSEPIYIIKTKSNFLTKQINVADLSTGSMSLYSYCLRTKGFLGQWTPLLMEWGKAGKWSAKPS